MSDINKGEEVAKQFSNYVNNYSCDPMEFVNALMNEHRTLQQSSFRVMLDCIKSWSDMYEKGEYDLRNEDTCKVCNKIVKQLEGELYVRFI